MLVYSKELNKNFSLQVFSSVSSIDANTWNTINNKIPFYKTHQFLSVIEKIQKDIQFRYVLIKKNEVVYAALYMQALDFSFKNLVNYNSGNPGAVKSAVKNYIGKKNTKLLNLGNVFFTGDNGVICNDEEEIIAIIPEVFDITSASFFDKKPSASLIANIYLQDKEKCSVFRHNAYHSFITEPDMFMNVDENWSNFEDYLNALSSKYRVRAKKVLQTSTEIIQKEFSLEDILLNKTLLEKLYNNVVNHIAFNMANLNIDFFEEMKKLYGEKCTILGYYLNDELISFACLFHVDDAILHVHYIGLNYEINKEYKLYNRMLLDFVRFAILQKKKFIHFGRTATEIKTTIGAKPNPLQAYLKMNNGLFNTVLPSFLKRIKPAEFIARNPFK
jgi:predicted N-acyltransferase